jgi:thioredoxin 1
MRTLTLLTLSLFLLVGCSKAPPPEPVNPVAAGIEIPHGMPNDKWFHENVMSSKVPVLLDFTATWCPPCKMMKPFIHDVEKAYGDRLKVVEIDVDENTYLPAFFQVDGIPRLILIKDGKVAADDVGGRDYEALLKFLNPVLGSP